MAEKPPIDPTIDPVWAATLARPATRGELLDVAQLMLIVTTSQAMIDTARLEADEHTQRQLLDKHFDLIEKLSSRTRRMIDDWHKSDD